MKRLILIIAVLMGVLSMGYAQAVKLGYVNTDRLLLDSNEAGEVAKLFALDKQNWTTQVRDMDDQIKQMERDFEIRKLTMNDATKRETQSAIDTKKAEAGRLLEEYFGDGGKAEQRYRELIDPLTKKIHDLIIKTAQDEKYTMIFDTSMGSVLYAMPTIDLTDQILLELNKDTVKPTEPELKPPVETPPEGSGEFKPPEISEPKKP
ncbi:MAG: OmpH family outer membrane protein [Candidatus Cloacimonas sp.]|jgi:outer membrane protein|nr:OmpH family outer membrane protein [Candidatus Cloacimonas sp.]